MSPPLSVAPSGSTSKTRIYCFGLSTSRTRLRDIKEAFIGGECQAIRPIEVPRHDPDRAALRIEAINCRRLLRLLPSALVIVHDSINRVGEPDRAIGFHDDIVRRVQALTAVPLHQDRDPAVIFGAVQAPAAMRAHYEAALPVARLPIRIV